VTTEAGRDVTADLWYRCYGVEPNSDILSGPLAGARRADGFIEVGPTLQVAGHPNVFALGDVSTAGPKMAGHAGRQAVTVAGNITALIEGRADLTGHEAPGVGIVVPIGPEGGAGQLAGREGILGPEFVAEAKGRDMMVDRFAERFGGATAVG
jgi:NADH dehydrogenase FAD-containing subunit